MDSLKVNETILVGVDFTRDKDVGVLIVGRRVGGTTDIINAFQGEEALEIYKKLITDKNGTVKTIDWKEKL